MENKVVKYAPKAVIDELDELKFNCKNLSIVDMLNKILGPDFGFNKYKNLHAFVYQSGRDNILDIPYEQAVINHLLGVELLQPEREPRYYAVVPYDSAQEKVYVRNSDGTLCDLIYISMTYSIDYEQGISRELAENIAKEFGGKTKEIK